jgi:hypothetical protein
MRWSVCDIDLTSFMTDEWLPLTASIHAGVCRNHSPKKAQVVKDLLDTRWFTISECHWRLVELRGIEPLTSAVRLQRSPI